ncbi:hypothetical protein NQ315_004044 [Exocentrus adspersus]|uniref:Zinc carboxypeptidase A 1 n=1 Tax=Exocentrus adspersus TaxID=1586481 RepID=A0AAV8W662_9CUCU|nr:hypothetical protein NQ315_004044 [Exocentrus adspersus]
MKFLVFGLVCLGLALAEEPFHYDGYKVYQIVPRTEEEAYYLKALTEEPGFDFWAYPRALNATVTVMVPPDVQVGFENDLEAKNMHFEVLINDVESTIRDEDTRQRMSRSAARGSVSFTYYMRYNEIVSYLTTIADTYPSIARLIVIGHSYEGRAIVALRISRGTGSNRPEILVDAGIHAREWIAPPVALYLINQLVENTANAYLSQDVDWVIIPSLNPDGYEYTHTNTRLWRKTRTPNTLCYGVDPNRNFDYYWMVAGASSSQCSEIYAGPRAFSESETQALRDYLHANSQRIKLYLTFHSYGNYLLYPWGYTSALPANNEELYALGVRVNDAIRAVAGTTYSIGTSTNLLYAAAGGSDDYAKGAAGVELAYCIELPGGGNVGFNPPATSIWPIVQETWEGIKAYHDYIRDKYA